jgi:hypothetical protein
MLSLIFLFSVIYLSCIVDFPQSNGKFGACFQPGLCKQSDLLVYAARPGLRLWRTDVSGLVVDTLVLKRLFNQEVPQFELFARPGPTGGCRPHERQLGVVCCFLSEGCVLSWNEYSVYVLDCLNQVKMSSGRNGYFFVVEIFLYIFFS